MDRACDNWKATMGRFNLNRPCSRELDWPILLLKPFNVLIILSSLFKRIERVEYLLKPFDVLIILLSLVERIERVKYFWNKSIFDENMIYAPKILVVSPKRDLLWDTRVNFNHSFSSISEYLFTDSLYRAVCFETFRSENRSTIMTPKWILWRIITTSWKFLSRRIFLTRKFYLITGRFS